MTPVATTRKNHMAAELHSPKPPALPGILTLIIESTNDREGGAALRQTSLIILVISFAAAVPTTITRKPRPHPTKLDRIGHETDGAAGGPTKNSGLSSANDGGG